MGKGMMTKRRMRELKHVRGISSFTNKELETKLINFYKVSPTKLKLIRKKINYRTDTIAEEQKRKSLLWKMCLDLGLVK